MGNSCGKQEPGQEGGLSQQQQKWGRLGSLATAATAQAAPSSSSAVAKAAGAAAAGVGRAGGGGVRTGGRGSTVTTARALLSGGGGAPVGSPHGPVAVSPPPPPPKRGVSAAAAAPPPPAAASSRGGGQPHQQRQRASTCSDEGAAASGADSSAAPAASANLAPAAAAVGGLVVSKMRTDCAVRDAYKLGRTLGKGGFAVVRAATDRLTGVDWAVKIMALPRQGQAPGDNDNTIEDILKEIDILCGLSHPNVVCLREYFAERGRVYLVTELVTGGELLGAVMASGACGERDARLAFSQLLKGIEYLHSRGVVHRDLKLENLLLTTAGELRGLKIADFGLARRVGGGGAFGAGAMSTVCGTPQYVAPEVIAGVPGLEYGPKVDAWSAGVVLFVLLGGYPPFWAESEPVLFGLVRRGHFTFDDPAWAGVSEGAKDLIRRLLVVDPERRLSAFEALRHPWILEGADECELPADGGGELAAAATAGAARGAGAP